MPGVRGLALITKLLPLVMLLTVALLASPVPLSDMPTTRPSVLSQLTVLLPALVVQFVRLRPLAVSVALLLVAVAATLSCSVVPLPMLAMLQLAARPGPVRIMPGQRLAVLPQVTVLLPSTVPQLLSVMGALRLLPKLACLVAPAPEVDQALSAPLPAQLLEAVMAKVSRNTSAVTCGPKSYCRLTLLMLPKAPGLMRAVILALSLLVGEMGLSPT